MKRQTYLRDESLLTLLSLHDFIIPEIQREYVWGSDYNSENILKPFFESIKKSAQIGQCLYAHGQENLHIGFLYSYKPQYIRDVSERITDEYLIDGQQRFTSLFFLLLVRAIEEDRLLDFNNLIRWKDESIAFDYKVRQLTHKFIGDLINKMQSNGKDLLKHIVNDDYPNWIMKDYQCDTTVKNIMGAIKCIQEVFDDGGTSKYYDYLLTRIHFWHFKTDVTSQGEELYITMNSRGEELADNEVQKVRMLKSAGQMYWGSKWEEWQTFFWRNRGQGDAKNFDADKGFNNLLSCIDAMGKSFNKNYNKIEYIELAVEALKFIVETDWKSVLKKITSDYYAEWINEFNKDIWARINTTDAKWNIDNPKSDTTQMQNAVLLWPLFYYYFEKKNNNLRIDDLDFFRLMHMCYLNYKSKKTNHAYIKDFIDLIKDGDKMLLLQSIPDPKFLSEENVLLSEIINRSSNPNKIESIIWKIQDKKYFLDGEDVGGNTIIDYIRSIQSNNISLEDGLNKLIINYDTLFPFSDNNEILLKRILLHYKGNNNELFWKRTSPYYDRNYETSSWKRIIRHSSFIKFYEEISRNHTYLFTQDDLEGVVVKKQDLFFADPKNRNFTISKWSDRRIAVLIDTVTKGHLWDDDKLKDLGFKEDDSSNGKPFIDHTTIGNRICGKRNWWKMVSLPPTWEWYLERVLYPFYGFIF